MHILVSNDDGPPSNQSSPYVHSLVSELQAAGHQVSVILPNVQRSWIGKAHMVGQTLTPTYYRPGTLLKDDGITSPQPFDDGGEEWVLVDGTPASAVQIGLYHMFKDKGPVDLVLSGPNYGRNTTALFSLSSGTIGGALEAAVNGKRAIALSYAFDSREHDLEVLTAASRLSTKLVEKFMQEWPDDVHLYSINVPLRPGVENQKIIYTNMIQNKWQGSSFKEVPAEAQDTDPNAEEHLIREAPDRNEDATSRATKNNHVKYKWAPNFGDVRKSVEEAGEGDGWAVVQGYVSVTPLRANYWHLPQYKGEIKLNNSNLDGTNMSNKTPVYAYIDYPDEYVQPLILQALDKSGLTYRLVQSARQAQHQSCKSVQICAYESLGFENALAAPRTSLICAYAIRKALIRKHYLSNTISTWLVKQPQSILKSHFKPCVHFELDFSEFLDEALVDAWDLKESMTRNEELGNSTSKEWWILKPGMSDGGNGIRLFSSLADLQAIFEEWDEEDTAEEESETGNEDLDENEDNPESIFERSKTNEEETTDLGMTSQLRHFVAQPYINKPLLLEEYGARKFHIRVYVLAVGALRVYVCKEMLALFAAEEYSEPTNAAETNRSHLSGHLTNTCFQDEGTKASSVHRFWGLESTKLSHDRKNAMFSQICDVVGEVFEAAAREQMIHFQTIPNAFEIFGVDFLIDENFDAWLLELNAYPDFKQTGAELQEDVVARLFVDVINVAVLPFFDSSYQHLKAGSDNMHLVREIDLGRG